MRSPVISAEVAQQLAPYPLDLYPQGRAPDGLFADIPGSISANGFPAFSDVSLPDVAPIEFSVDLESGIISWTNSGAASGAFITVDMTVSPIDNAVAQTSISCTLVDDGIHQIADGVIPADANSVFSLGFLGRRTIFNTVENDGAFLFVSSNTEGPLVQ